MEDTISQKQPKYIICHRTADAVIRDMKLLIRFAVPSRMRPIKFTYGSTKRHTTVGI
jgi:hypothetical protein